MSAWPLPTQPPSPLQKRRVLHQRQVITDQAAVVEAQEKCFYFSGNDIYSCFPTTEVVVAQGEWASFVWNSRRPELTQTNLVDIYLFRGDSQQQILHFQNIPNPTDQAGLIRAQVNDSWFGQDGLRWSGQNVSYPFYWVITRSDKSIDGNQVPQPIFTAVQTTVLDSVASSSSQAASSLASLSSVSRSKSLASDSSATLSSSGDGHVQHALSDTSFPRWAIAVIVVLGFLAITATCLLTFLILRRLRRQRTEASRNRNSINSNSPMILNQDPQMNQTNLDSPILPPSGGPGVHSNLLHDGASTDSGGPFSGADAAIMAQAFRSALRQPDFMDAPVEEGDSPVLIDNDGEVNSLALSKEEGRDIRSVSSSRGVKVESAAPAAASTEESTTT